MMLKKLIVIAISVGVLNGCAIMSGDESRSNKKIIDNEAAVLDEIDKINNYSEVDVFVEKEGYWLGDSQPIDIPVELPAVLFEEIDIKSDSPASIQAIASTITERSGIRTRIAGDVILELPGSQNQATTDITGNPVAGASKWEADVELMGTGREKIPYNHQGSIKDFLDFVAARYNIMWAYENNTIVLSRYVTRHFKLDIMSSEQSVQSESGGTNSENANSQKLSTNLTRNIFNDVSDVIKGMLTEKGIVSFSPSTGSIVVTDTATAAKRIEQFVDEVNHTANRQVAISFKVYTVNMEDRDEFNFSWDMIYTADSGSKEITLKPLGNPLGGANDGFGVGGAWLSGPFAGSTVTGETLSLKDNVSISNESTILTLNNRTKSVEATRTTTYLRSVKTTRAESGDSLDAELEPADITFGLNFIVTPRILDDDRIVIEYTLDIKDELGIFEKTVGDVSIEQPEFARRKFMDDIIMRSGESLVLTGLDLQTNEWKDSGIGESWFKLFGGGRKDVAKREVSVIVVTPVLVGQSLGGRRL